MKALILTGGHCADDVIVPAYDIAIAADCGLLLAKRLGITPELTVGDFDSADINLNRPSGEVIRHPAHKDQTDTMLAVELAVSRGCDEVHILGGLGGRTDHSLSNILFLEALADRGVSAVIDDGDNTLRLLLAGQSTTIGHGSYRYFSLFALDFCTVSVSGCEYPLENGRLVRNHPYALSNETHDGGAFLECHEGKVLLVRSERLR